MPDYWIESAKLQQKNGLAKITRQVSRPLSLHVITGVTMFCFKPRTEYLKFDMGFVISRRKWGNVFYWEDVTHSSKCLLTLQIQVIALILLYSFLYAQISDVALIHYYLILPSTHVSMYVFVAMCVLLAQLDNVFACLHNSSGRQHKIDFLK